MKTIYLIMGSITLLLSGALIAVKDGLLCHFSQFKAKFPGLNESYWNPQKSWVNKWAANDLTYSVEKFRGSSRWFVFMTDAWHMVGFVEHILLPISIVLFCIDASQRWYRAEIKYISIDLMVLYIIYVIGYFLTWTILF